MCFYGTLKLLRNPYRLVYALALSNLAAIHQKTPIGRLSAYCGAVNAGAGEGAGIAYLWGGGYKEHTVWRTHLKMLVD